MFSYELIHIPISAHQLFHYVFHPRLNCTMTHQQQLIEKLKLIDASKNPLSGVHTICGVPIHGFNYQCINDAV
jgi:hypothetical protein